MKPDEIALLARLAELQGVGDSRLRPREWTFATDVGIALGMHYRRAEYVLNKWQNKQWWECGVSTRTGWLTAKGLEAAKNLRTVVGC